MERFDTSVDVVIPVHNEAECISTELEALNAAFCQRFSSVRFLVVENGSSDGTWHVLNELTGDYLVALQSAVADYGAALRLGVQEATAPIVLLAEIDFCDIDFAVSAMELLQSEDAQLVQSSKAAPGASDRRPAIRRLITWGFNRTLRLLFGFSGTDTHGMKLAPRAVLKDILSECVLDGNLLATEMVLRARRSGLHTVEVPVSIEERRTTSIRIFNRIPSTLRDLAKLRAALRK